MTTIGSLCTGYGGLDMAAAAVIPGARTAWVADTSPGAAALLAHRMPDVPNLGDITATDWRAIRCVDVITAGFPCQPVSNAGLRRGADDDRWIWPDDPDRPGVATAIRVLRPRLVLLENVAALAVRGLGDVLADLAALRYVGSWACVRASDVGAPHRRERIFIAAWPADADRPGREGARPGEPWWGAVAAVGAAENADREPRIGHGRSGSGAAEGRRPRSDAGGSGRAPAADADHAGIDRARTPGRVPERHPARADRAAAVGRAADWGQYGPAIARWERTIGRPAPAPTEPGRNGQRLSPRFVEWVMGLDEGHVTDVPGLSRNAQLALLGNGVVPQQAAHAYASLLDLAGAAA